MPTTVATPAVVVRMLAPTDSLAELTAMLHRAYRPQVEMGLRPLAGRQSVDITRQRTSAGECFVAVYEGRLVGMILLNEREEAVFPPHFLRPDVSHFSLFAVEPDMQGRGIGRRLLEATEIRARELGSTHLALSMAEPDSALMNYYLALGFRFVEHWHWPYTNYRSAILTKEIVPPASRTRG